MTDQEQEWATIRMKSIEPLLWRAIEWKHYETIEWLLSLYLSYRAEAKPNDRPRD